MSFQSAQPEFEPVKGLPYSIGQLKNLAEQGAERATKTSRNRRQFGVQFEPGSEASHAFNVSSTNSLPAVYLRVRIEESESGLLVTRTLETITEPAPNPFESKVQTRTLDSLRLGIDSAGNPIAYLGDKDLSEADITRALIDPVTEAVGDG